MAKMTLTQLQAFAKSYVDTLKQAGEWESTINDYNGLVEKIGKQITIDGSFNDKLTEFSAEALPFGKTIEEWFADLIMPQDFDGTGANTLSPKHQTFQEPSYSYDLGKKTMKHTIEYDRIESAMLDSTSAANMTAKIMGRLYDSQTLYEYNLKKQLLANAIEKAVDANQVVELAKPVDEATGSAFIKKIKDLVEDAQYANEGNCLAGDVLIGASPSLTLFIKKGILSSVEVDTLAGAFNKENLAVPCTIKVLDDFADADADVWGYLYDPRSIKLHPTYRAMRTQVNAEGDFINYDLHTRFTGFISKFTYVKVLKNPTEATE